MKIIELTEEITNIAKHLGFKKGVSIGWKNSPAPTGKWKSFNHGALPSLIIKKSDDEGHNGRTIMIIHGEIHFGTSKHVEGTPLKLTLVCYGTGNKTWKCSAKTVDDAKRIAVEQLLVRPDVKEILKKQYGSIMEDAPAV